MNRSNYKKPGACLVNKERHSICHIDANTYFTKRTSKYHLIIKAY